MKPENNKLQEILNVTLQVNNKSVLTKEYLLHEINFFTFSFCLDFWIKIPHLGIYYSGLF